ncbi:MAG TPA: ABC transporter permease [Pyrinomonadaceae bacterium]|nr:ABC transporter permease [Pyrinomonadaceae bacterium]
MSYEFFLALRYLRGRRGGGRRATAQVTALAAAIGIACGVAALVVALALSNGFRDELREKILRGTAHLTLLRADGAGINEWGDTIARVKEVEGVVDASATAYTGAMLSGRAGAAYAVLRGVDTESESAIGEVRRTLIAGIVEPLLSDHSLLSEKKKDTTLLTGDTKTLAGTPSQRPRPPSPPREEPNGDEAEFDKDIFGALATDEPPAAAIIGAELAARTGLDRVGAEGWIITGEKTPESPGLLPRARRVRVAGVFRSGLYDYDASWVYVPLAVAAQSASGGATQDSSAISVEVADIYATEKITPRVRRVVGDRWTIVDWSEANRPLFAALELERRIVALIISLIMIVAALSITTTLVLIVVERRADIAILGAMGARPRGIMLVFVIEGAIIGAVGAVAGLALGLAACFVGDYFELVRLPADVYAISSVPFHPTLRDTVLPALVAFAVSLVATIYPARAASRVRPAEGLRYDR